MEIANGKLIGTQLTDYWKNHRQPLNTAPWMRELDADGGSGEANPCHWKQMLQENACLAYHTESIKQTNMLATGRYPHRTSVAFTVNRQASQVVIVWGLWYAHSVAHPWVPISSQLILWWVYLLPFLSYLSGSKSVSACPHACPTQIRWQLPLCKLLLRRAANKR